MSALVLLIVVFLVFVGIAVLLNRFPPFENPDRVHPGCDCPRCAR